MTGSTLLVTRCIKNAYSRQISRYFSQEYQPKTLKKASRFTMGRVAPRVYLLARRSTSFFSSISQRTVLPMAMQITQSDALSGTVPKAGCKNGV